MGSSTPGSQVFAPTAAADHSRFVQRIRRRYAAELALLPPGLPNRDVIVALVEELHAEGRDLACAMRVARQLVLERLAVLDVEQGAAMEDVTQAMTDLAEATLDLALAQAQTDHDQRYGAPRTPEGQRIEFWVVGMGKLGARELNVSSDIDLIYVYEEDGQTDGPAAARRRPRVFQPSLAKQPVHPDRRHHRRRLRVPGRPGAAPERQLRPAGGEPRDARGIPAGAGPRVGTVSPG